MPKFGHNIKDKYNVMITIITVITLLIIGGVALYEYKSQEVKPKEEMTFTTNKGNVIKTEYKDLGNFSVKIPKDFEVMSDELLKIKYPYGNVPKKAYSNEDASISIVYNLDRTSLNGNKLSSYIESLKLSFSKMGYIYYYFPHKVNGNEIHTFSFNSQAIDTTIYNYMAFFEVDGELVIFSFNCTSNYQAEWSSVAEYIVKSIKIK